MGKRGKSSGLSNKPHIEYDKYGKDSPITVYPDQEPFEHSVMKDTVYHGSVYAGIKEFSTEGAASSGGIFFTEEKEQALFEPEYKKQAYPNAKPTLYTTKLDMRNPLYVGPKEQKDGFNQPATEKIFIDKAKKLGYDSVIFDDGATKNYVVFSPKQVKILTERPTTGKMVWGF